MKLVLVQALRALAALLVVIHHGQHEAATIAARTGQDFTPSRLLPWEAGVDVFFVISGFIIVHASAPLYRQPGGARRFLAHRTARLVPLYWLVSAAFLAVALVVPGLLNTGAGGIDPGYVIASFLFWPALRADGLPVPLYSLGWTLNCEMFFYLVFAIGIGWGRRPAVAWLVALLGSLAALWLVLPGLPMPLAFWAQPIVLEFAFGAVLALVRAEGFRIGSGPRIVLALLGFAALSVAAEPTQALRPLLYGLPALCLVAAATLAPDPRATREGPSESRVVRWAEALGDASYALYLVHPFVLRLGREVVLKTGLGTEAGPWPVLAVMVAAAVIVALAVFRLVERPLTRRARALLDPPPPRRGATSGALDETDARVPR